MRERRQSCSRTSVDRKVGVAPELYRRSTPPAPTIWSADLCKFSGSFKYWTRERSLGNQLGAIVLSVKKMAVADHRPACSKAFPRNKSRCRSICKLLMDKPFSVHTARKCTESTMTPSRSTWEARKFLGSPTDTVKNADAATKMRLDTI